MRLGPYEVLSRLGAGGMGEVWRARDTRLQRDVAIKVLPVEVARDESRLKRFEKEARCASALNHPNIVTIYDIGRSDSVSYIAMELVEGKTLRELFFAGTLPIKRTLSIAAQIAEGLASAHDAGLVHRDLKPENLMVTKDGLVKILDFGLAKLARGPAGGRDGLNVPTESGTGAGVVLGTAGYMSPEQASGQPVDFRSDQFSFGSMLYEMVTGRRAFQKKTGAETLSAIIGEEPTPAALVKPGVPAPLGWLLERCLVKAPEGRYASTRDLARDLASIQVHLSDAPREDGRGGFGRRRRRLSLLTAGLALVAIVVTTVLVLKRAQSTPKSASAIRFSQVTFDEQAIADARFAPDGETFVYGAYRLAEGEVKPPDLFVARVGSPESRKLGIPEGRICSVSTGGQIALLVGGNTWVGTLAEAALEGGSPRSLLENVRHADWSPDGRSLAVVHAVDGRDRLEFPVGKVLYESPTPTLLLGSSIFDCRVSPKGDSVAFFDRELRQLSLVDSHKRVTRLFKAGAWIHFAWSPRGDEVWYAKFEGETEIHGVTPTGRDRFLMALPGDFQLHDVSRKGRILLEKRTRQIGVFGRLRGDAAERDLRYRSGTEAGDLSSDGSLLLFNEMVPGWATDSTIYLRESGKTPVPLGRGFARALSPDGKWVIASRDFPGSELVLLATGAGQPRTLPKGPLKIIGLANWLPDGHRIVFAARAAGEDSRLYVQDVRGGLPKPITPQGVSFSSRGGNFVSPDGKFVVGKQPVGPTGQSVFLLYSLDGSDPRPVRGLVAPELPVQWSEDGHLFVDDNQGTVYLLDPSTGKRKPWMKIPPPEPTHFYTGFGISRDGKSYVRSSIRFSSNLFVLDGIK
jgi:eukaryotic-like serine/threonine-protein kinase